MRSRRLCLLGCIISYVLKKGHTSAHPRAVMINKIEARRTGRNLDTGDAADTSDTEDAADTSDTGDAADTSDTGDAQNTSDTGDAADTSNTGDETPTAEPPSPTNVSFPGPDLPECLTI